MLVVQLVSTAFSFNLYVENSRYLDIVTVSSKQIHEGKSRNLFAIFFIAYYEKENVAIDQQGVWRTIPLKDTLKAFG